MEVTRKNFNDSLPLIKSSIAKADFLAIDTEFTGLRNGRDVSIFDTPREYYKNLLNGTSEFLLIQFGLCAFYWDEKIEQYRHEAYNFFLFPRGKPGPEKIFMCQSSSLDFLASQGFDFNKLIREGISYMPEAIESKLRETLKERQKGYSNDKDIITIPQENKQQIEEICEKVRCFLNKTKEKEMEVDRCNAFIRRLLFQELGRRFKNEAFVETVVLENKNRVLKVTRLDSASESKDMDTQKKEKEWEEFELAVGFSKVARMISESEKLVIGHNMILDLLHTLNHFFQPLPAEYASFKEFAHCMFPMILDTKYMSSLPPFKDKVNSSVLTHLLTTLSETPFSLPKVDAEKNLGYTLTDEKQHEAGYDAYITGLCFLAMHAHLSKMRGDDTSRVSAPNCAVLKPFLNKLFLARTAHYDSPYMNLAGVDPTPSREHMFYLTFPKEWQRNEINQLFSPFGPVTVQFLDETSALIVLARKEQARDVARLLAKNKRICLLSYAEYKSKTQSSQDAEEERRLTIGYGRNMTPDGKTRYATKNRISTPNKVISSPHKVAKNMLPGKVERSALPEKVERTALLEKVERTALPEKVERTALPEKLERSAVPEKVGRSALPEKVERSALPEKVERSTLSETDSSTVTSPQHTTNRKRTSSGVFQVDETEPPPKKTEVTRSNSDGAKRKLEVPSKGRRRNGSETGIDIHSTERDITDKVIPVIETFKNDGKSKCVDAFKESDSWD